MWEKALEVASRLTHPISFAAFSLVVSAIVFRLVLKSKIRGAKQMLYAALVVITVITLLGLAPLLAITYLQSRGVYHVRILVVGLDRQPVSDAKITSSIGGEIKKANGTWELDIAPQTLPANRIVTVSASVENDFLAKSAEMNLGKDYFPTIKLALEPLPPVMVRGVVLDERRRPAAGASVAIEGYPDETAKTYDMGSFAIRSHAAKGQMVTVTALKNDLSDRKSGPADGSFELVLRRP